MAFPLLAILSAIPTLFDAGKRIYEEVSGKPSQAATPAALQAEVEALPPEQQAQVAARMEAETAQYKAETDRLRVEEGELSPEILKVLPQEAAARIAILRMETRPLLVRRFAHVILLPIYVTAYDSAAMFINGLWRYATGHPLIDLFAEKIFGDGSIYVTMYTWAAPTAASIVIAYMGLRTREKNAHNGKTDTLTGIIGAVKSIVSGVKK